jgi:hypothetical protein
MGDELQTLNAQVRAIEEFDHLNDFKIVDRVVEASVERLAGPTSDRAISRSMILQILRDRIYTGDLVVAGRAYKGTHEPIVALELWKKVQAMLASKGLTARRKNT